MMMTAIFSLLVVGAVVLAVFIRSLRVASLALWVAGLGVGALFLTLGAEFLAILQWILTTLVGICLMFFAVMFGEYRSNEDQRVGQQWATRVVSLGVALGFAVIVYIGSVSLHVQPTGLFQKTDLRSLGVLMTEEHLLSLEVLALTLFLVLIGCGVIARNQKSGETPSC